MRAGLVVVGACAAVIGTGCGIRDFPEDQLVFKCDGDHACSVGQRCAAHGRCTPRCTSPAGEDDPFKGNTGLTDAEPLVPGSYPDLTFACRADWFRVNLCAGGRLEAELTTADEALLLVLLDSLGTPIARSGAAPRQVLVDRTDQTNLYVVVEGDPPPGDASYGLEVEISGCGQGKRNPL